MGDIQNMVTGLEWRKLDLHLHTGASHDFNGDVSARDVVDKCIEAGLDAIAVTDHNTGSWIDDIKDAAVGTDLVVFPGVEITCPGGKSGIHILAIFDTSKGTQDVVGLLEALGITHDKHGDETALSSKSIEDTIDIITERRAMAIPAHVNSSKGICKDMRGQQRIRLIKHPALMALEATDFSSPIGERTIDYFDGNDPNYQRKLAIYQASDNPAPKSKDGHSLEGIGTRTTYFKLDVIDLEGLRQCFIHPEARIRFEPSNTSYARIVSLKVGDRGFLQNQEFIFHPGLNSIIGGKGVGKSLVIEFVRFCLGCASTDDDLIIDHLGKLEKQLGSGGTVELVFQTASGTQYCIQREYASHRKGAVNCVTTCINMETGEEFTGDISSICQVLAYSQTEVIKIAENKNAQLELIDRFIDDQPLIENIESIKAELIKNDKAYCNAIEASDRLAQTELDIRTKTAHIADIDQMLSNELFESMKQAETKDGLLRKNHAAISQFDPTIDGWLAETETMSSENTEFESEEPGATKQRRLLQQAVDHISRKLSLLKQEIADLTTQSQEILDGWNPQFEALQSKYNALVSEQGGDQQRLEATRRSLQQQQTDLEEKAKIDRKFANQLEALLTERISLLDQLDQAYQNYFELRNKKFQELTESSSGKLKLRLEHAKDVSNYAAKLSELLRGGSNSLNSTQRTQIAENVMPRQFVDLVLQKDVEKLAEQASLTPLWAERVIDKLWSSDNFRDVLNLQHSFFPDDVPYIQYAKTSDAYANLDELSVGQKCTALLIIALSEGKVPILIDQPEDALDIVTVWENISLKLLGSKQERQFILTTHNSSVAVSADSDQFIVLEAGAESATIKTRGAIDRTQVKQAVIDHLEGGDHSYALRQNKLK